MPKVKMIPIDKIRSNPFQPRETFRKEKIKELADSIKEEGLIQPILVRKKGDTYQIIAGERRWRAFQFLKREEIPAIKRKADDIEARELSIAENWHRLDLEPRQAETFLANLYEEGKKVKRYKNVSDMADKIGIPRGTLNDFIIAHRERVKQEIDVDVTYQDIARTKPIANEPELRKKILKLREEDKIKATDLREFSKTVKTASSPVRKALLDGTITPEEARTIDSELTTIDEKIRTLESMERDRTESVEFYVNVTKHREEWEKRELNIVEIDTGDVWVCPTCEKKFRLMHVDPEERHRFREVVE